MMTCRLSRTSKTWSVHPETKEVTRVQLCKSAKSIEDVEDDLANSKTSFWLLRPFFSLLLTEKSEIARLSKTVTP